jgi:spermidine/putrescine transport system ATP-binding protein
MQKERTENRFEGVMIDSTHVEMLGTHFVCNEQAGLEAGDKVCVKVPFDKIELMDNKEDGMIVGDVRFILYKGDHYHLTVRTFDGDNIYVDTHDVWDDRDIVGVKILAEDMTIERVKAE